MKDVLGQEVTVGSKVLWGGGKTQYAGFAGGPVEVIKLTAQKVRIRVPVHWAKDRFEEKVVYPSDLVVVDRLLVATPTEGWRDYQSTDEGTEMLVQSPELVDKDFCPDGVAVGTVGSWGAICATWHPYQDCYDTRCLDPGAFQVAPLPRLA